MFPETLVIESKVKKKKKKRQRQSRELDMTRDTDRTWNKTKTQKNWKGPRGPFLVSLKV